MRKSIFLLCLGMFAGAAAQTWKTEDQYIQRFAALAVSQMEKYRIPASITLAQGLLETGGGQSRLAIEGNNHFGIKCKEDWTGKTMRHTDDAPNECFRVYDDPHQSFEDHSIFLTTRKYYANLFLLDPKDFKAWAFGLKKAGYATNPRYAYILLDKIQKYNLQEFDNVSSSEVFAVLQRKYPDLQQDPIFMARNEQSKKTRETVAPKTVIVPYQQVSYAQQQKKVEELRKQTKGDILNSILVKNHPNGGLKYFVSPDDLDLELIAKKFDISTDKLRKINELDGNMVLKNRIIFLEPKNSEGNVETYVVEGGDNMHLIAQKFAIKMEKLYARNHMPDGSQPKPGELLYLRGRKPRN